MKKMLILIAAITTVSASAQTPLGLSRTYYDDQIKRIRNCLDVQTGVRIKKQLQALGNLKMNTFKVAAIDPAYYHDGATKYSHTEKAAIFYDGPQNFQGRIKGSVTSVDGNDYAFTGFSRVRFKNKFHTKLQQENKILFPIELDYCYAVQVTAEFEDGYLIIDWRGHN